MALRAINTEWKYVKSYASEANLMKRIEEDRDMYPEHNDRFMVVRTPEGRWTVIVILDKASGGYVGRYDGFMKV
jgi:hypothetical protein